MNGALLVEAPAEHVRRLTPDRPNRLNAITSELYQELHEQLRVMRADRSRRVVVLTGAGRGFCAAIATFREKRTAEFAD